MLLTVHVVGIGIVASPMRNETQQTGGDGHRTDSTVQLALTYGDCFDGFPYTSIGPLGWSPRRDGCFRARACQASPSPRLRPSTR